MDTNRMTVPKIVAKKATGEKITCVTAYDYPTAMMVDEAGVDMILVGDSLANTALGYDNTLPVTMDEMRHHARAVVRGAKKALVIGDMPFLSYQTSMEEGIRNAGLFMKDGCGAVKLETATGTFPLVQKLVEAGIPVMAHIGFTPQWIHMFGGHYAQGKTGQAAAKLIRDAVTLEELGVFGIVLELVPVQVAKLITERVSVPTIGIGAGPHCDGQVQVIADLLGLLNFAPRHAKRYVNLRELGLEALRAFAHDVKGGVFPEEAHAPKISDEEYEKLLHALEPRLGPEN